MPVYVYRCNRCGSVSELIRSMNRRDETVYCVGEECRNNHIEMERVMTAPAFRVKENIIDRVNRGEQLRKEMKAKGEW